MHEPSMSVCNGEGSLAERIYVDHGKSLRSRLFPFIAERNERE